MTSSPKNPSYQEFFKPWLPENCLPMNPGYQSIQLGGETWSRRILFFKNPGNQRIYFQEPESSRNPGFEGIVVTKEYPGHITILITEESSS